MVSIKKKNIGGKEYLYAEHSFRLHDRSVKKISKLIKSEEESNSKAVTDYFLLKEKEVYEKTSVDTYTTDHLFTPEKIKEIEGFRVEYWQLLRKLTEKQMSDILDRFTVNFTYESNAIEGNSLTLKDVTMITLHENIVPKDKDLREVYETRNTRIAHDLLFARKIKMTQESIIRLHAVLVKDTGVSEGYKKLPNYLLMRNVKTTPPEEVEQQMARLINDYDTMKGKVHPLKIAAEMHARFERIHPFEDGNGRVGRIMMNSILLHDNYPPIIIRKAMRSSYFKALESYDHNHKERLIRLLMDKQKNTFLNFFKEYVKYL